MLFRKKRKSNRNNLPRAVAFVDYEHWYISLERIHGLRPNIDAWFDDLKEKCNLEEVIFFANFSKFKEKEVETKRIRAFTNKIIDTYNPDQYYMKDYTDFIILDNIYQKALSSSDVNLFIIFSGDGHFSSVVAFLRNFCNKKVGIYAVKGSLNHNLAKNADWTEVVPTEEDFDLPIQNYIFTCLEENERAKNHLTFNKIVELTSSKYSVDLELVRRNLSELIDNGYISQEQERVGRNRYLRVLNANWEKIKNENAWNKDAILLKRR